MTLWRNQSEVYIYHLPPSIIMSTHTDSIYNTIRSLILKDNVKVTGKLDDTVTNKIREARVLELNIILLTPSATCARGFYRIH